MLHCVFTITLAANEFLQVGTCNHRNCLQQEWIHTDCSRADSFESKTLTMGLVIELSQHFSLFKPLHSFCLHSILIGSTSTAYTQSPA